MTLSKERIQKDAQSLSGCLRAATELNLFWEKNKPKESPKKVAFLSSFTIKGFGECLKTKAFLEDIAIETYVGEYGQWKQEILGTKLYDFNPDIIFILVDELGIDKDIWHTYFVMQPNK